MKTKYFTAGDDASFTTHVIRVHETDGARIVATFNSWWRATKFCRAMNDG